MLADLTHEAHGVPHLGQSGVSFNLQERAIDGIRC